MRLYVWMLTFLMFSFCNNSNPKNNKSNLEKDKILYGNLYEYKDLYSKFIMVDCPDFVRFLQDGSYYVMNDCGIWGDPRIDTIAETGKYRYFKNKLSFFDRKIRRNEVGQIFSSDLDTIHLEIVRISKDTLIFKESELDTLPIYFSRSK